VPEQVVIKLLTEPYVECILVPSIECVVAKVHIDAVKGKAW
jgi:hypothetical protein